MPLRILIAPDKFKGVQSALEIARHIESGIREIGTDWEIELAPVADGGEGTAEIICHARGGEWRNCSVHDAWGRPEQARYAWLEEKRIAVLEMSDVAGLKLQLPADHSLERVATDGLGEMMIAAAEGGARKIAVGVGGSATNDGGTGMARALGYRFLNAKGEELKNLPRDLAQLARIDATGVLPLFRRTGDRHLRVVAAVDVRNPLLGPEGATHVFARQKGASTDGELESLESWLARLADVVRQDLGIDAKDREGAGAGGGMGFGLLTFCGAEMRTGFDVVADATRLRERIAAVDVVITGEGSLDRQTLHGKAPIRVAQLARDLGKPVFAIAGKSDGDPKLKECFDAIYVVADTCLTDEENIGRAPELLREGGRRLAKDLLAKRIR